MKTRIASEITLVCITLGVAIPLLDRLRNAAFPLDHIGNVGIPILFAYAPLVLVRLARKNPEDFGLTFQGGRASALRALITAMLILPVFVAAAFVFQNGLMGKDIRLALPTGIFMLGLWNLVAVAAPEELFFRGYLQTRLGDLVSYRIALPGTDIGAAAVIASLAFTAAHLITDPNPGRLAVFFPSLLFGWLRERSGSLLGPILMHWAANMTVALLYVG